MKNIFFKNILLITTLSVFSSAIYAQQFKVLLFTKTDGFHHESINEGVTAIKQLANRNNFSVDWVDKF